VPQPLLFIPLADVINHLHLGNTLTSVILTTRRCWCRSALVAARLFQDRSEGARGGGADRRRQPAPDNVDDLPAAVHAGVISAGIFAFTLSQNEFLYALIFLTKSSVRTVR